jgi:hypothetical protein
VSARFAPDDLEALERGLSAAISRIRGGEFRPTPSAFACGDCPALDVVCAGPRLYAVSDEPGAPLGALPE